MSGPIASPRRPRILFVDDDQRVLDGLSASLRRQRSVWDMEFVCGGTEAATRLRSAGLDAVVTDMRMPGIDGEAVLILAREHCPGAVRVILSGQTTREVVARTLGIAHQFLSKPCGVEELRNCLQSLLELSVPLDQRTRDVLGAVSRLPVSARIAAQLRKLCQRPDQEPSGLAACIEQDAVLTAKILHVAGAGFFAARQRVTSTERALAVLGVENTLSVVEASAVHDPNEANLRLSRHVCATARLMERMIGGDNARLCGLLHGLGKIILLDRFGDDYAALLASADANPNLRLHKLELERFGLSHAVLGAHLIAWWGLDPAVVEAVRAYPDPDCDPRAWPLAVALHAACALTRGNVHPDPGLLARAGMTNRTPSWSAWAAAINEDFSHSDALSPTQSSDAACQEVRVKPLDASEEERQLAGLPS